MRSIVLVLVLVLGLACSRDASSRTSWQEGCFIYRDASGAIHESDHARCMEPRRPYSTFKLANALIAVDAGLLDGPDAPMTWDRVAIPDDPSWPDVWRKPHTLRSAIRVSAVPYFRTLARTLGDARMRAGLAVLRYGNQNMSGGLDQFWLRGGFRISAREQLDFVEALARGSLRISAHAQAVVREVSARGRTPGMDDAAVLHGKTGSGLFEDGPAGWLVWQVGWIERGPAIVPYAAWQERHDEELDDARGALQRDLNAQLARL